ncbi:hypothetical protein [uncultured Sphingomonas sp.]|uniref:hypothetical protein n=1 Tax=uncultured Sphingomonas sp. TaxID=158754 RepID=UPI0025971900|nr:hypothetical protein [uncultured Sphingomonas sp.]
MAADPDVGNPPDPERQLRLPRHPFGEGRGARSGTRGKLQTQPLVTHRFPLGRINDAFAIAQDRRRSGAIFVGLEL